MTDIAHGPTFALEDIPFSHYGSWFNLSPVTALHTRTRDLHLVSHKNGMHAVLRLLPVVPDTGSRAPAAWHPTPGLLTVAAAEGHIEFAYETADVLRVRGRNLSLVITPAEGKLTPFTGTYLYRDPVDGSYQFSSYETGRRYRITLLSGAFADVAGAEALAEADRRLTLHGAPEWEAVIEEMDSARVPYATTGDFDTVTDRARTGFRSFARPFTGPLTGTAPAANLAAYVLWSATVRPEGLLKRPGILMSKHWMDKVWSWDHCFNALAVAASSPELAWDQFQLPFDHQDERGALPDSVTHSEVLYNFVKPPIHGWALNRLRARLPQPLAGQQLTTAYERLRNWTRFWLDARRVPGSALPHYQHGNDSGWDNATTFDSRRLVEAPDLAAFLVLQLKELARMAVELNRPDEADEFAVLADAVLAALLDQLWDGDRFLARSPHTGTTTRSRSLLDLMPIVLGEQLPPSISAKLADRIRGHLTDHGLATEHPDSPCYEADGYWRGPIWAPSTVLIEDGLRRAGHTDLADEVSARFRVLCETSGFAENFDARTGAGLRDRAYTWTAAAYLLLAEAHTRRNSAQPVLG
ncbi:amylo-alpha-1,6-glucosidase [Streptacidiphilus neutrinimicus]|uniref:amylo-alpha-1,6-glucosidase n=1 Tax=Streptacidiphilus neutrinimicus TaxID=105420 RepID=UPI0005A7FCA6|nr:glycogen debranching protein [Streptacidiphilus neutrinimicus]